MVRAVALAKMDPATASLAARAVFRDVARTALKTWSNSSPPTPNQLDAVFVCAYVAANSVPSSTSSSSAESEQTVFLLRPIEMRALVGAALESVQSSLTEVGGLKLLGALLSFPSEDVAHGLADGGLALVRQRLSSVANASASPVARKLAEDLVRLAFVS